MDLITGPKLGGGGGVSGGSAKSPNLTLFLKPSLKFPHEKKLLYRHWYLKENYKCSAANKYLCSPTQFSQDNGYQSHLEHKKEWCPHPSYPACLTGDKKILTIII